MKTKRSRGGDAVTEMLLTTFRLNGAFLAAADDISAPAGLTAARWQVLGTLMWGDMTVSAVAREMGLSRQAVQRIANILVGEGMIVFIDNPNDKRAKLASATSAGRNAINSLSERQHVWANHLAKDLDAVDIENAVSTMQKILMTCLKTDS